MIKELFNWFKLFLEKLDLKRDQLLFSFIKKYWPRWLKPNHLTYIRISIGIMLFVALFYYGTQNKLLIIILFVIAVLTDMFDGSVARCLNMKTKFGAIIDPAADRIIIIPVAIYSLIKNNHWLLLFYLLSELINGLISAYAMSHNIDTHPDIFAKTKMFIQSIAFGLILITWPKTPGLFIINILWISLGLMVLSIFIKTIDTYSKLNINNLANKKIQIKKIK